MKPEELLRWEPLAPAPRPAESAATGRAIFFVVAFGTLTGFLWAYFQGFYRLKGFPLNTFLFKPEVHLSDLTSFFPLLETNTPYALKAVYPPFNFILMEPFSWFGGSTSTALWVLVGAGGLSAFMALELSFMGLVDRIAVSLGIVCFSYPFLFAFDRGNVEIFVTLALAFGVYFLQRKNFAGAGILFGLAGALKVYPGFFAVLLLIRRKWIATALAVATAGLLTWIASAAYGFTLPEMQRMLGQNVEIYNFWFLFGDAGLAWGNSLFGAAKVILVSPGNLEEARALYSIYAWMVPAGFIAAAGATWLLPLRLWEQVTLLTVALVVLPPSSGDYRLLHFLVPIALFIRSGTCGRARWWYALLFALLMVPKAFVLLRPDGTNLGVLLNPLLMLLLAVMVLATGFARLERRRRQGSTGATHVGPTGAGTVAPQ